MKIILLALRVLWGIVLVFLNEESAAAHWRYVMNFSPLQTFIVVISIGFFILFFFWLRIYEKLLTKIKKWQETDTLKKAGTKKPLSKIARWIIRKYSYFEKHKDRKIVKTIRSYGHFGLYIGGFIPFLLHPTICAYKLFIRSKFGPICIWLGGVTRLALWIFFGLKLINSIF